MKHRCGYRFDCLCSCRPNGNAANDDAAMIARLFAARFRPHANPKDGNTVLSELISALQKFASKTQPHREARLDSKRLADIESQTSRTETQQRCNVTPAGTHRFRPRVPLNGPPAPPLALTPLLACDPQTDTKILWHIAKHAPQLRRWLIANPRADAALLEYVSQAGGPGVKEAFDVLFASFERINAKR